MSYGLIYKILLYNKIVYVGQTVYSIDKRWKNHVYKSQAPKYPLHFAIRKYGIENFTQEFVCECNSLEEMNRLEEYYTSLYRASIDEDGYVCRVGNGHGHISNETKQKLSKKLKGHKNYNSKKGKDSPIFGRKRSKETKRRISIAKTGEKNPNYGKTFTKEHCQKISEAHKGIKLSEEHKLSIIRSRIVKEYIMISPTGELTFIKNMAKFCKNTNLHPGHMRDVANGKKNYNQHKGWKKGSK
jgi:group I intron endonuclease